MHHVRETQTAAGTGRVSATLTLGGVRFTTAEGMSMFLWSTYAGFTVRAGYVLLIQHTGAIHALPVSAFDGDELEQLAEKRINRLAGRALRTEAALARADASSPVMYALAVIAPVTALLLPPMGIVLGVVSLPAAKRSRHWGRYSAVYAIICGSVATLASSVVVGFVVFLQLRGG